MRRWDPEWRRKLCLDWKEERFSAGREEGRTVPQVEEADGNEEAHGRWPAFSPLGGDEGGCGPGEICPGEWGQN